MNQSVDLGKYRRVFVLFLLGCTIVVGLLRTFTDFSVVGFSFMIPALSMWAAIGKFAEDHGRVPDDAERGQLMRTGMLWTTALLVVGTALLGFALDLDRVFLLALFLLCLLINWASLRTGFWMSRGLPATTRKSRR